MAKKSWFEFRASGGDFAEIAIFSDIGAWGVTAQDFYSQLRSLGKVSEIRLSISSNGGDVSTGFAIYNMLNRHPAAKVVTVEGIAASMASVIAMSGDTVKMPSNAMLMIHNPWGSVAGKGEEIISFGEALKVMARNIANTYRVRTGLGIAEIRKMMNYETWLSAAEAVAMGFADIIEKPQKAEASIDVSRFNRVPRILGRTLKGKTMAKGNTATDFEGDDNDTRETIRAEILAYQSEVKAICLLAGMPELADDFITHNKTRDEVIMVLEAKRVEKATGKASGKPGGGTGGAAEVNARNNPRNQGANTATIDPPAIWDKWNRKTA